MKKVTFIMLFFFSSIVTIWAGSTEDEKMVNQHVYKFSRGVVNMGSAPLEIPKQMVRRAQDGKTAAGQLAGYLTGAVTGVGWTFWRFGSGVVDVFSAPFTGNEKGMITPEFVTDENPLGD